MDKEKIVAHEIIEWLDGQCEHTVIKLPEEIGGNAYLRARTRWHCHHCRYELKEKWDYKNRL